MQQLCSQTPYGGECVSGTLAEERRRRLMAEVERCRSCGDRRGLADASASLRILGYLFGEAIA